MAPNDDFLGSGWSFETTGGGASLSAHRVAEAKGEEKIRQSIWLILSTAPGERIGRSGFGCGVHDLVFAPRTASTMSSIATAVSEALSQWEPRIQLLGVDARPHPNDPLGILIDIRYEVRATNSRENLVYPFYLAT